MSYEDHKKVLEILSKDQEAEEDIRAEIDEVLNFINHPQGQWEPNVWSDFEGRPRYTFDQCKPAIKKVWAEMAANQYSASVQPVGGGATEDVSNVLDGLFRNIYNMSSFDDISTKAGKKMITTGLAGWRIVAKYINSESFYQDLAIIPVNNFHRRVWFDANAELQTKEDAKHVFYLSNMSVRDAEELAGRKVEGVNDNRDTSSYTYKPDDTVIIGEILYKKKTKKMIYLLDDEDLSVVDADGLREKGLTEDDAIDSREADTMEVYSRKFDNLDWIGKPKLTVFNCLPIIPEYAEFDITEDGKNIYRGLVRDVMDHQRVFNYSESRKVEESVLAPRQKLLADNRVVEGYEEEFGNINRDPRAVQLFNGVGAEKSQVPFFPMPGPQPNPAVTEISDNMIRNMQLTLGLPNELETIAATRKDSDYRFESRSSMGQVGTFEYYRSHKVALEYTAKVILGAIPKVYDTARKIRIIDESNQSSEVAINSINQATGESINNLLIGKYDVVVNMGKDFESRQADANTAILELGSVNPDVVTRNTDIIATNIKAPGMRTVADRERAFLMQQGVIPESQWTDLEREKAAAAQQQQQQPDPNALIAQAQVQVAQAEADKVQTQLLIEQAKLEQKQAENQAKIVKEAFELQLKEQQQQIDELSRLISGAKTLAEIDQMDSQSQQLDQQGQLISENQIDLNGG